jgi:hypothetical protein
MALTLRWRAPVLGRQLVLAVLAGTTVLGVLSGGHMDALKAAGAFSGGEIGGIAHYVEALKGNIVWLGTAMGLVVAVVGILFMAGHSRAHDIAIKTIAGLRDTRRRPIQHNPETMPRGNANREHRI